MTVAGWAGHLGRDLSGSRTRIMVDVALAPTWSSARISVHAHLRAVAHSTDHVAQAVTASTGLFDSDRSASLTCTTRHMKHPRLLI